MLKRKKVFQKQYEIKSIYSFSNAFSGPFCSVVLPSEKEECYVYDKYFHIASIEYLLREIPRKIKSIIDILSKNYGIKTMASKPWHQKGHLASKLTYYLEVGPFIIIFPKTE